MEITDNVRETNEILDRAFQFTQISPYSIISNLSGSFPNQAKILHDIHMASITLSLIVATLLLMVDFFRKTVNFEWSSKWENVLIFLIKIIVIKQVVQNSDVIMGYLYQGFNYINRQALHASMDFAVAVGCLLLVAVGAFGAGKQLGRLSGNLETAETVKANEDGMIVPEQEPILSDAEQITVSIDRSYAAVPTEDLQLKGAVVDGKAQITLPVFDKGNTA